MSLNNSRTIDTVNVLGSEMNKRSKKALAKALKQLDVPKMLDDRISGYTPISSATNKMYEEYGINTLDIGLTASEAERNNQSTRSLKFGSCKVVNPPFQFNENDDVRSDNYYPEVGRIYNERIYSRYPVVIFEVGSIIYNKSAINKFLKGDKYEKLAKLIKGENLGILGTSFAAIKTSIGITFKIATFPFSVLGKIVGKGGELLFGKSGSRFANFKNNTRLYRSYLDEALNRMASMMGLLDPYDGESEEKFVMMEPQHDGVKGGSNDKSIDAKQPHGAYLGTRHGGMEWLGYNNIVPGKTNQERDYIPFLIDSDITVSENFSNSTSENPLAGEVNSRVQEVNADDINAGVTADGNVVSDYISDKEENLNRMINSIAKGSIGQVMRDGNGRLRLPDMWESSTFDRSVSFKIDLSSPYGDDLSVFESVMIPLMMLITMAAPRQMARDIYGPPFMIKAFSRGLFNIPLGMIESLSIERGESQNDWTINGRPRTVKINISIKDLSPTLMLSMDKGMFSSMFQLNDGFTQYLAIMSGLSLADQFRVKRNFDRWWTKVTSLFNNADTSFRFKNTVSWYFNDIYPIKAYHKLSKVGLLGRNNEDIRDTW